jgi:ABC-type thiamine transport system substrate-binding protein
MKSVKFNVKIENGTIRLPKNLREFDNCEAHVVVKVESSDDTAAKKERLFAAFKKLQEADVFRNIEDPVEWQRKLRDEWD